MALRPEAAASPHFASYVAPVIIGLIYWSIVTLRQCEYELPVDSGKQ